MSDYILKLIYYFKVSALMVVHKRVVNKKKMGHILHVCLNVCL